VEGRYDNPVPELTLSPSQGSMNSATAHVHIGIFFAVQVYNQPCATLKLAQYTISKKSEQFLCNLICNQPLHLPRVKEGYTSQVVCMLI
jgi:hypothetical protein